MSLDPLSELLQSLPRQAPSPDFTARTVARAAGRTGARLRLRPAFATALMAVVLLAGGFGLHRHQEQARLRQLRAERQQIQRELNELKVLSSERDPRVFVGSSGPYDFVVGVKQRRPASPARPVSLHIANDGIS